MRMTGSTADLAELDVLGQDGRSPFIRHLGLAVGKGTSPRSTVAVYEMGPPLNSPGTMQADVHATASLTDDELQKIKVFIDRHVSEHRARRLGRRQSYCIVPHTRNVTEEDGTYSHTQFSCSGFVIESYRFARIDLIDLTNLPEVPLTTVLEAYPDHAVALQSAKIRVDVGLEGQGPWRLVLCGYVVHALKRPPQEVRTQRYVPAATDSTFP